jgi:hypothetical protein
MRLGLAATILSLATASGAAQDSDRTALALSALASRDYTTAASLLQSAVQDPAKDHSLATFFLASLYYQGKGAPFNRDLACGLFLRVAATSQVLSRPATAIAYEIHQNHPLALHACNRAVDGVWPAPTAIPQSVSSDLSHAPSVQPTLAGLLAFAAGDFTAAAQALKPVAESLAPDDVASLFMGLLYDAGAGIERDPLRACAHYVRAGPPGTLFAEISGHLVGAISREFGNELFIKCVSLSSIGFRHGFAPVTFELAPGEFAAFDLEHVTIVRNGREERAEHSLLQMSGSRLHLLRHTPMTSRKDGERRNFIEAFVWLPGWHLFWHLFEIVDLRLVPVVTEDVTEIKGVEPPGVETFDAGELARLQLDHRDTVEWILAGKNPRSGIIASHAETQERAALRHSREAADAAVEWDAQFDPYRRPSLGYADAGGCQNTFVYGWTADRGESMSVRGDLGRLGVTSGNASFDLADPASPFDVRVQVHDRPRRRWNMCSDVRSPADGHVEIEWRAVSGMLVVDRSADGVWPTAPASYRIRVRLVGAEFVNDAGVHVSQQAAIELATVIEH